MKHRFHGFDKIRQREKNSRHPGYEQRQPISHGNRTTEERSPPGSGEQDAQSQKGHEDPVLHVHQQGHGPEQARYARIAPGRALHRAQQIQHEIRQKHPALDIVVPHGQINHAIAGKGVDEGGDEGGKLNE